MRQSLRLFAAVAVCLMSPLAAQAGDDRSQITDQSYQSGKYSAVTDQSALANCPPEMRGMYRGDLYCRTPTYQVIAQRHPSCPKDVWGMYRGDLYCFGRR